MADADLESCVLAAFKNMRFPAATDGAEHVVGIAILMTNETTPESVVKDAKQSLLGTRKK